MKRGNLHQKSLLQIVVLVVVVAGTLVALALFLRQSTETQQKSQAASQSPTSNTPNQDLLTPGQSQSEVQSITNKMLTYSGGTYTMGVLYDLSIDYPSNWKAADSDEVRSPDFTPVVCKPSEEDPGAACNEKYADPETGAALSLTSGVGYLNYGEPNPTENAININKKKIAGYKGITYQDKQYCVTEDALCYRASFRVDGAKTAGQYNITLRIGSKSVDQKEEYLKVFNQAVASARIAK